MIPRFELEFMAVASTQSLEAGAELVGQLLLDWSLTLVASVIKVSWEEDTIIGVREVVGREDATEVIEERSCKGGLAVVVGASKLYNWLSGSAAAPMLVDRLVTT